jgi:hypothetical protein
MKGKEMKASEEIALANPRLALKGVQVPKEGWLTRQLALARSEVAQRPELRQRAAQFAGEEAQGALGIAKDMDNWQDVVRKKHPD